MTMGWKAERAGNRLFHCHVMTHVSPVLHVDGSPKSHDALAADSHAWAGVTGMVLGVTVVDGTGAADGSADTAHPAARRLTLVMQAEAKRMASRSAPWSPEHRPPCRCPGRRSR
jgi:hypothetical protein